MLIETNRAGAPFPHCCAAHGASGGPRLPPPRLKRRLLAAAGWRVISVPFYEWNGFATANGQQTYLERAVAPLLG